MKKFWVRLYYSSTKISIFSKYYFYRTKDGLPVESIDYEIFDELTGLKLKPGEIVQCELKVIKKG